MDKGENYRILEDDFTSTFIRELMPGILHNFANPLNGIMGRAKLLQRRIDDAVKKMEEKYPETASGLQDELNRIKNDIRSINRESDTFFDLFRDASGKFYALATRGEERFNLSQLLAAEMRFANFYLEFKHDIRKETHFDEELPELKGDLQEWTLVLWKMIRFAMNRALASEKKQYTVETKHDTNHIIISMLYSGEAVPVNDQEIIKEYLAGAKENLENCCLEQGVQSALKILKENLADIEFDVQNDMSVLSIYIPYHA